MRLDVLDAMLDEVIDKSGDVGEVLEGMRVGDDWFNIERLYELHDDKR